MKALPKFTHPSIHTLYTEDLQIEESTLRAILALPRESLIRDLHAVVYDSIERFDYYLAEARSEEKPYENVIHALSILAEIKSEESGKVLLDVLRQSEEYLRFWFGNFMTEGMWEFIYQFWFGKFDELESFMREKNIFMFSHSEVSVAVLQMALHNPSMKASAVEWYKNVFRYLIECDDRGQGTNPDLCDLLVADAIDLHDQSVESLIDEIYRREMVDPRFNGTMEEVRELLAEEEQGHEKREMAGDIFERYEGVMGIGDE